MFERTKLTKLQLRPDVKPQDFDDGSKDQSSCSNSIPDTKGLRSHLKGSIDTSGASNESCNSIIITDSSNQTPGYLSANSPRKQKLVMEIKSRKQEIKNLKKNLISLSQKLSNYDTVEHFLRLSEKYLSPELFNIVKSQINKKKKTKRL